MSRANARCVPHFDCRRNVLTVRIVRTEVKMSAVTNPIVAASEATLPSVGSQVSGRIATLSVDFESP
jgi:hypothetical protein